MSYNPNNPNGQATKANSQPVVIASDDDLQGKIGIVTETAPGSDTASSGLNGRLQRIAQRLTSLLGVTPAALGQTTKSASTPVTIASDQEPAHDAVNSGNPTQNGYEAIAHGANPTAVGAGDRTKAYANRAGVPFVIGGHPNIQSVEYYTTGAQTDDDMLGAIGAGTKVIITSITVIASKANTVDVSVRIGFGTANVPTQGASGATATAKVVISHPNIPPGSGVPKGNGSGIVGIGGDGEELRITNSAPTSGSLIVQIDYYTIES